MGRGDVQADVAVWYDGEVPQEIYEDPEFTQLFEDVNGRTELTLYLAPRAEG